MGLALQCKGECGICHRIFLEYSMSHSTIFQLKKKRTVSSVNKKMKYAIEYS